MLGVIPIPVQFKSHKQLVLLALTTGRGSLVQHLMLFKPTVKLLSTEKFTR